MDGKKRISRLRNAEKWKKMGFGCFFKDRQGKKVSDLNGMAVVMVGVEPKPIALKAVRKKNRNKDVPRTDGKVFDFWSCQWISPPKPGRFGTAQKMIEALEKKGFKRLGSGHYSTVLAKPGSDKVIKVTRHQDNWIDYVKWASEKGYAGGFAPRVYSWKKFPGGWSWAVMERMEKCIESEDCYDYRDEASSKTDDYSLIFSLMHPAIRGNVLAGVYMEDLAPGALSFLKDLRETMRASDIRGANTMIRKDGSLCFTDPCAGSSTLTKTRLRSGDFSPSVWRYLIEGCYRH